MNLKLIFLIQSIFTFTTIFSSNHRNHTAKNGIDIAPPQRSPIDIYLRENFDKNNQECNAAFNYLWSIPNCDPNIKHEQLYEICKHAEECENSIDPDLAQKYHKALQSIQKNTVKKSQLSAQERSHARHIDYCYGFFQNQMYK
jgi:hypothetical protein